MKSDPLEALLQRQISEIDTKISVLTAERKATLRMLASVQAAGAGGEAAVRRNSAQRVVVEKAILEYLADGPANGSAILQHVKIVYRAINPTTVRSYIHRLNERGLISRSAKRGVWQLPLHR